MFYELKKRKKRWTSNPLRMKKNLSWGLRKLRRFSNDWYFMSLNKQILSSPEPLFTTAFLFRFRDLGSYCKVLIALRTFFFSWELYLAKWLSKHRKKSMVIQSYIAVFKVCFLSNFRGLLSILINLGFICTQEYPK